MSSNLLDDMYLDWGSQEWILHHKIRASQPHKQWEQECDRREDKLCLDEIAIVRINFYKKNILKTFRMTSVHIRTTIVTSTITRHFSISTNSWGWRVTDMWTNSSFKKESKIKANINSVQIVKPAGWHVFKLGHPFVLPPSQDISPSPQIAGTGVWQTGGQTEPAGIQWLPREQPWLLPLSHKTYNLWF